MKTISYTLSKDDRKQIKADLAKNDCVISAMFAQLERDGLASINKEPDDLNTFENVSGDIFKTECNPDINPEQLKREEKKARAHFNRVGAFYFELIVEGESIDTIGGFVGNDFYGSGYDFDFKREAVNLIKSSHVGYGVLLGVAASLV